MGYNDGYDEYCYYCEGYADYNSGNQDAFQCKNCGRAVHIQCLRKYELMADGGAVWKCPHCGTEQRAL